MSFLSEAQELMALVNTAVDDALDGSIAQIAKECVAFRVGTNVYGVYTPHGPQKYERRKDKGGLSDEFMYSHSVDAGSRTLTVSDNRSEVAVVESGEGYQWLDCDDTHIQHWHRPRPYFADAENDVIADGEAEAALINALAGI